MIVPNIKEATTATQKVVKVIAGKVIPAIWVPGKLYGISTKSETMVVKAYKANTFINQAKIPKVNKLRGKKRILRRGTRRKLISIKANAPIIKLFTPPV